MKKLTTGVLLFALFLVLSNSLACSMLRGSSPTSTFKAFFEAQKNKDVPGIKKTLSKGSLEMLEKGAKEQKKTLDASLKEGFDDPTFKAPNMPETRNEKIDDNTATLEIQNDQTKKWETMYFVKEDGDWKVALDKTVEELLKKIGQ